jgi:subtilase family serine protease
VVIGKRSVAFALVCAAACGAPSGRADSPSVVPVCGAQPAGYARCFALEVVGSARPFGAADVAGYSPADLQSAYALPSATSGTGQTVGIVDAFDDPTAESDLAEYRSHFGLPPCTTANGCFRKVDQTGGTNYPPPNTSWDKEISLDLDMVSAVCPNCSILLVETTTNSKANLYRGEDEAAALGANEISDSWGAHEYSGETNDDVHFHHPGVVITAGSGDSGYGVAYPAASQYVTAVGGTSLTRAANARGWKERAWAGSGSGCSAFESKPSWQTDGGCGMRTIADVSAVADSATPVAVVFESTWTLAAGTSVSSPIIAAVYALAGNAASVVAGSYPYAHAGKLYDVRRGTNGTCSPGYLCTARRGYDGPTGLGSPKGADGF